VNSASSPDPRDRWDNPLASRYASAEMSRLWSDNHRYKLWDIDQVRFVNLQKYE
jgi:hypothetical protein